MNGTNSATDRIDLAVFLGLVRDHLALPVSEDDAERPLDELAGWDSVHLLHLLTVVERHTGAQLPLADVLDAGSLAEIHRLVVAR